MEPPLLRFQKETLRATSDADLVKFVLSFAPNIHFCLRTLMKLLLHFGIHSGATLLTYFHVTSNLLIPAPSNLTEI